MSSAMSAGKDLTATSEEEKNEMSTSTDDMTKVKDELKGLEVAQATQAAALAGAQATQAAAHAGTWSTMVAGGVGLIAGMFLGIVLIRTKR